MRFVYILLFVISSVFSQLINDTHSSGKEEIIKFLEMQNEAIKNKTCLGIEPSETTNGLSLDSFAWRDFIDPMLKREFRKLSEYPWKELSQEVLRKNNSNEIYYAYEAKIPIYSPENQQNNRSVNFRDIFQVLKSSKDYNERLYYWKEWRKKIENETRELFKTSVNLNNKYAKLNGYNNSEDLWTKDFEMGAYKMESNRLFNELFPFYKQLHSYIRSRLREVYGKEKFEEGGPLPDSLFAGKIWSNIEEHVRPYPSKLGTTQFVNAEIKRQNITMLQTAKLVESFFKSLGFPEFDQWFWTNSSFHESSEVYYCNFATYNRNCLNQNVSIRLCTEPNFNSFMRMFHYMSVPLTWNSYKKQHRIFQTDASPAFFLPNSFVLSLSARTPSYLHSIQMLNQSIDMDEEMELNNLMYTALIRIPHLLHSLADGMWKLDVYDELIPFQDMNKKFWEYRLRYLGLGPPIPRSEENFDAGAVPTLLLDIDNYLSYFFGGILEFQFHKGLCQLAGHTGPLHHCNIYGSEIAGKKFREMLELGSSQPWTEALSLITGGVTMMDASPLLEYFKPLYDWLAQQNANRTVGW